MARVAAAQGKEAEAESFSKDASVILTRVLGPTHPDVMAVAEHLKRHDHQPLAKENVVHPHARFLAIPTFLAVGWQVLHVGKDWRIVEGNIRRREAKEDKAAHHAAVSAQAATAGRNGR